MREATMRTRTALALGAVGLGMGAAITRVGQPRPATHDMHGRTVMVTGANSGIGLETAVALARGGARVLATARDPGRGRSAVATIRARTGSRAVELVPLDLASLASVRACAEQVTDLTDPLDVLVHNAGAVIGTRTETEDGFETTIGVNHLGPFLLTHLLASRLLAAPAARVVTVASLSHRQAQLDLDDLMFERRPYRSMVVYGTSKLANILFARELARQLAPTGVTSNSLHPGTVRSGFGRDGDGHPLLRREGRRAAVRGRGAGRLDVGVRGRRPLDGRRHRPVPVAPSDRHPVGGRARRRDGPGPVGPQRSPRRRRPGRARPPHAGRLIGQATSTTSSRRVGPSLPSTRSWVTSRCSVATSTNSSSRRSCSSATSIWPS